MLRGAAAVLVATCIAAIVLFAYLVRQMSAISVGLAAHQEMRTALAATLDDQKRLARLDPERRVEYRARFDDTRKLLQRVDVVDQAAADLLRTLELILLSLVALIIVSGTVVYMLLRRDRQVRLARIRTALGELSTGSTQIAIGDARGDVIGRIARMIEDTSQVMARDRKRIQYLQHLSAWQEAARRHAHEIRTPLTAARMEIERMAERFGAQSPEIDAAKASVFEELDRLRDFTTQYSSFAKIGEPVLREASVADFITDFCETFRAAWSGLAVECEAASNACIAKFDREMVRQVMVNLCSNSAASGASNVRCNVGCDERSVMIDVADNGPGIDAAVRERLFQPYVTTRKIGEGMGLGLAISKKIMLDHGGDLDVIPSASGATFRLTLPAVATQ